MRSQSIVIENASIDLRPHYLFDSFSTVHSKIVRYDVRLTQCARLKHTRLR